MPLKIYIYSSNQQQNISKKGQTSNIKSTNPLDFDLKILISEKFNNLKIFKTYS